MKKPLKVSVHRADKVPREAESPNPRTGTPPAQPVKDGALLSYEILPQLEMHEVIEALAGPLTTPSDRDPEGVCMPLDPSSESDESFAIIPVDGVGSGIDGTRRVIVVGSVGEVERALALLKRAVLRASSSMTADDGVVLELEDGGEEAL